MMRMLMVYQSHNMVIHANTFGHILLEDIIITCTDINSNCRYAGGKAPPSFVGTDYYCESGAADTVDGSAFFFNDQLWDRSGCITSTFSATPTQLWCYRELSAATTGDIEARICVGSLSS